MKTSDKNREQLYQELVQAIVRLGYPQSFGILVAENLRTEKTMTRMLGYLRNAKPKKAEEIADEMLAIMAEREQWVRKKTAEFYNSKYNDLLNKGLEDEEE